MKLSGIYAIRCKNRIYIGKSVDIASRWSSHLSALSKNLHQNKRLQSDFHKHGMGSLFFTVLEECKKDELDSCEKKHILTLRDDDYNVLILKRQHNLSSVDDATLEAPAAPKAERYIPPQLIVELLPTEPGWTVQSCDMTRLFGIGENTLRRYGKRGYGAPYARFEGGEVRYDDFWINLWLDAADPFGDLGGWSMSYTTPDGQPLTERQRMDILGIESKKHPSKKHPCTGLV